MDENIKYICDYMEENDFLTDAMCEKIVQLELEVNECVNLIDKQQKIINYLYNKICQ